MGKKSHKSAKKSQKNAQSLWMDSVYSSTISIFVRDGNLDGAFLEVVSSSDWGVLTPSDNVRICSEYDNYIILFYECTFSILGLCLSYTVFEIDVLKHLVMVPRNFI